MELAVVFIGLVHLFVTPFTKVEESFNVQATHDLLYHTTNISQYDHLEFPGVVPRTFIGPLVLAAISAPIVFLASILSIGTKFLAQYVVRSVLCVLVTGSLIRFQRVLKASFGVNYGQWFLAVTLSQYHLLYYSSRPLPNIIVLPLVLLAVTAALSPNGTTLFIILSGAAVIWFRMEVGLLLGILLIIQLLDGHIKLTQVLKIGIPAGVALVTTTVLIDSLFWRRLVWPEAEVFYFNIVLNKSGEWGTSPFLWYFYSALPRGLGSSVFLVPLGIMWDSRVRRLVLAATLFIFCFSFLPHKELRFIIYTFPLFNTAVASACHRLWVNRLKSRWHMALALGVCGHLLVNAAMTVFLLLVAKANYPGGEAMAKLHQLVSPQFPAHVHIENLAAQTGVSRFTEINPNWRYSKVENLTRGSADSLEFTHLLVEAKSKYSANLKPYSLTHKVLAAVDGFSEIAVGSQLLRPLRIKMKPLIFILERNPNVLPSPKKPVSEEDRAEIEDEEAYEAVSDEDSSETVEEVAAYEDVIVDDSSETMNNSPVSAEKVEDEDVKSQENLVDDIKSQENVAEYLLKEDDDDEKSEEDDLIATESIDFINTIKSAESKSEQNGGQSDELDDIVQLIEERLNSGEHDIENALLENDILNDILALSSLNMEDDKVNVAKLKDALKIILQDYKEKIITENVNRLDFEDRTS